MHDYTKPDMSPHVAEAIRRHTDQCAFMARVSSYNRRAGSLYSTGCRGRYKKSHPVRSTSSKAIRYYAGDGGSFRFRAAPDADPSRLSGVLVELQALGVPGENIELA